MVRLGGWAAIAGAVLLVVMTASPAAATIRTGGASVRTADVFIVNGESGKVSVACPRGQRALAAGVQWRTADGAATFAIGRSVSALLPKNGGHGWIAVGRNSNVDALFRLVIRCLPDSRVGTVRTVTQDLPFILSTHADGYVACEPGEHVVGGGAAIMVSGPPRVVAVGSGSLGSSAPIDGRTWIANGLGSLGTVFRTAGLCASSAIVGDPALVYEAVTADQSVTVNTLTCPAGQGVLTGGMFWTNALGSIINTEPLGVSRPTQDGLGWTVNVWGSSHSAARVVVMMFCSRS